MTIAYPHREPHKPGWPMKSIYQKVQQLSGLTGTKDLSDWEAKFVASVVEAMDGTMATTKLTSKQVEKIDEIFERHFA